MKKIIHPNMWIFGWVFLLHSLVNLHCWRTESFVTLLLPCNTHHREYQHAHQRHSHQTYISKKPNHKYTRVRYVNVCATRLCATTRPFLPSLDVFLSLYIFSNSHFLSIPSLLHMYGLKVEHGAIESRSVCSVVRSGKCVRARTLSPA